MLSGEHIRGCEIQIVLHRQTNAPRCIRANKVVVLWNFDEYRPKLGVSFQAILIVRALMRCLVLLAMRGVLSVIQ